MKNLILSFITVLILSNISLAQSDAVNLPNEVRNILNQNFPKWNLVKNACKTSIFADFNGDKITDYVVLITSKKGGDILGFISQNNTFNQVNIKSLDKIDAELTAISEKDLQELNGFSTKTCGFEDATNYIFANNDFHNLIDYLASKRDDELKFDNEFIVKGPNPWLNTGIDVEKGCIVILYPRGKVDVNAGWGKHDAYGTEKFYNANNYPVRSRFRYGLAAQITSSPTKSNDKNKEAWAFEYEGTHLANLSGRLWLVVNDDNPHDNLGEFRVRVRLKCD